MASKTITIKGNQTKTFTLTNSTKVKITGSLSTGRSSGWFNQTTGRHPTKFVLEGASSGVITSKDSKGTIGSKRVSWSKKLPPDTYTISGIGAGDGSAGGGFSRSRDGQINLKVSYKVAEQKNNESNEDRNFDLDFGGEIKMVENIPGVSEVSEAVGIPPIAVAGVAGLLIWIMFFR